MTPTKKPSKKAHQLGEDLISDQELPVTPKMAEKLAINRELVHLRTKLEVRTVALRASMSLNVALISSMIVAFLLK